MSNEEKINLVIKLLNEIATEHDTEIEVATGTGMFKYVTERVILDIRLCEIGNIKYQNDIENE